MARSSWPRTGRVSGANSYLHLPSWLDPSAATIRPPLGWILALHGLGGTAQTMATQGLTGFGGFVEPLCAAGYGILAVDMPDYPSSSSRSRLDALYADMVALDGRSRPTVGGYGKSDGGAQLLDWLGQNPSKLDRLFLVNPLTDLRWGYGLAGYTPAYDTGSVASGGLKTSMDAAFGGDWASNSTGYRVNDHPELLRGIGVRILMAQATDDATLPPNAAPWFVSQINDPLVTNRSPQPTDGHNFADTAVFTSAEIINFFRGWT